MQWRVAKELRGCEGIAWLKRELLAGFDSTRLEWITARRVIGGVRETKAGLKYQPFGGVCKYVWVDSGQHVYRINARVFRGSSRPRRRSPPTCPSG